MDGTTLTAALSTREPVRERVNVVSFLAIVPASWTVLFALLVGRAWLRLGHLPWPRRLDTAGVVPSVIQTPLDATTFPLLQALVLVLMMPALLGGIVYALGMLGVVAGGRGVERRRTWLVLTLALWAPIQILLDPLDLVLWAVD